MTMTVKMKVFVGLHYILLLSFASVTWYPLDIPCYYLNLQTGKFEVEFIIFSVHMTAFNMITIAFCDPV